MNRGVTLIEILIYLALLTIAIGGLSEAAYALLLSADRNQTSAMLQEEGAYLVGRISYAMSNASSITLPAPNASGATLSLVESDGSQTIFRISKGKLTENGSALNNSNTSIENFLCIRSNDAMNISLTLEATTSNGSLLAWSGSTTYSLLP
jgi:Tfp pilus assembly protein PilE